MSGMSACLQLKKQITPNDAKSFKRQTVNSMSIQENLVFDNKFQQISFHLAKAVRMLLGSLGFLFQEQTCA